MERQKPDTSTNEIDLYIRTYYSLLRSSGDVRVRAFEEAHSYSNASLHPNAGAARPDIAAFGYAAGRLAEWAAQARSARVAAEQLTEQFGSELRHSEILGEPRPTREELFGSPGVDRLLSPREPGLPSRDPLGVAG